MSETVPMQALKVNDETEWLRAELERRDRELTAILKISEALSARVPMDDLIKETLRVSLEAVHASAGTVYLYDSERDKLVFRYVLNRDNEEVAKTLVGMTLDPGQGIAGEVFQTGQPLLCDDPASNKNHLREIEESVGYVTRNMATVPLISMQGRTIGVLQAINKETDSFDDADLKLLTIMATQAASAIETTRLYDEARAAAIIHYLGDLSHDIKNMMTPVTAGIQLLEMMLGTMFIDIDYACRDASNGEVIAQKVKKATEQLKDGYPDITEMVGESSKVLHERVKQIADALKGIISEPVFELYDVNTVVMSVVRSLSQIAEMKSVELDANGLEAVPEIFIDKQRLYNAIYNLVNNAIPETPKGGKISVRTRAVSEGDFPEGNYLMIEVKDTGKGMNEEVKRRLFTDQAISTKKGGTGLGTRIIKNVADAHGAQVSVESYPGKGATFYFKLPLKTAFSADPLSNRTTSDTV